MSKPRTSTAYPAHLQAMQRAFSLGELIIPTDNPLRLRLEFQGLRGALRKEKNSEIIDSLGFFIQKDPPALILRSYEATKSASDIFAALAETPSTSSPVLSLSDTARAAEDALDRLLGKSNA